MNLFSEESRTIKLPNAELDYIPNFYSYEEATSIFKTLYTATKWREDEVKVFGKVYKQPRLTALYSETQQPYSYSGLTMYPEAFSELLLSMKYKIENVTKCTFTSVLLNLYRNGNDSNGWHADNEKELGEHPIIASLSLGQERWFHFKHRTLKEERHKVLLTHGSLLVMKGEMQEYWLHQVPKTKKSIGPRINLTFRKIYDNSVK